MNKSKTTMNFLVTGVTGFLGSALAEKLLVDGYNVVGVGRRQRGFLSDEVLHHHNFILKQGDLSREDLGKILIRNKFDGIFHLASQQSSSSDLEYADFYQGNVDTTFNVVNLAKAYKIGLVVYASTVSFLRDAPGTKNGDEPSQPFPMNYYELTKYMAERLLAIELGNSDTKTVVIRFPSLFGKNHLGGLIYTYYQLAEAGRTIEIYGNGNRRRNFLYIDDAVNVLLAVLKRLDKLEQIEVISVGSKESIATIDVARLIKDLLKSSSKVVCVNKVAAQGRDVVVDITKAQRILKFNPPPIKNRLQMYVQEMQA